MSKAFLAAAAVLVVALALGFHFRYRFVKSELRRGILVLDTRGNGGDCHLVDSKRAADEQWPVTETFGSKAPSEEVFAKMIRTSDGLEASFCKDHPELLDKEITVVGVRVSGDAIGQDCTNRSCFQWVRLRPE